MSPTALTEIFLYQTPTKALCKIVMDWNSFIRESDPQVQADLSKPTRDKMREARNAFRRLSTLHSSYRTVADHLIDLQVTLIHQITPIGCNPRTSH